MLLWSSITMLNRNRPYSENRLKHQNRIARARLVPVIVLLAWHSPRSRPSLYGRPWGSSCRIPWVALVPVVPVVQTEHPRGLTTSTIVRFIVFARKYSQEPQSGFLTPYVYATLENKFAFKATHYFMYCSLLHAVQQPPCRKSIMPNDMLWVGIINFWL